MPQIIELVSWAEVKRWFVRSATATSGSALTPLGDDGFENNMVIKPKPCPLSYNNEVRSKFK